MSENTVLRGENDELRRQLEQCLHLLQAERAAHARTLIERDELKTRLQELTDKYVKLEKEYSVFYDGVIAFARAVHGIFPFEARAAYAALCRLADESRFHQAIPAIPLRKEKTEAR